MGRAECHKPLKEGGANQRAATISEAIASSDYQPKGVWEGRGAHITAKATDSIRGRSGCWTSLGGGTLEQRNSEQERPYLAAKSGKGRAYNAGWLKSHGAGREPAGSVVPVKACKKTCWMEVEARQLTCPAMGVRQSAPSSRGVRLRQ